MAIGETFEIKRSEITALAKEMGQIRKQLAERNYDGLASMLNSIKVSKEVFKKDASQAIVKELEGKGDLKDARYLMLLFGMEPKMFKPDVFKALNSAILGGIKEPSVEVYDSWAVPDYYGRVLILIKDFNADVEPFQGLALKYYEQLKRFSTDSKAAEINRLFDLKILEDKRS